MKHASHRPRTVWSRDAMPLVPARFRSIYTILLPSIDIGLILFGISSLFIGSKIVNDFTLPWFSPAWALTTLIGASVALVGLALLHDRIELVGRFAVGIGLLIYIVATGLYVFNGSPSAVLPMILTTIRLIATVWRISDLAGEIARKEAANGR
jgi:hypothetical protein